MHKNAMDIFIEVIRSDPDSKFVRWWNLGYTGNPWRMDMEKIRIAPEDEVNWLPLTKEQANTPRR
jgi:hypothetical protein